MMTKEEILDAAAQIFRLKGYHATSMNDIAGAVNLQKASLYHHVSSKQEILLELLDQAIELLTEQILVVVQDESILPDEKLRQMMRAFISAEPLARLQYVSCADRITLEELDTITNGALLSMAVYVGKTRLIDNWILD